MSGTVEAGEHYCSLNSLREKAPTLPLYDDQLIRCEMIREFKATDQSGSEVGAKYGYSKSQLYVWLDRFEEEGLEGLVDRRKGPKGPTKVTPELEQRVLQLRKETDLSVAGLSDAMAAEEKPLSPATIHRILDRNGVPQKTWPQAEKSGDQSDIQLTLRRVGRRFESVKDVLNEKQQRRVAGAEAQSIGYAGVAVLSKATSLSRPTVRRGRDELLVSEDEEMKGRVRRAAGGQKKLVETDPSLVGDLRSLIEGHILGDPQTNLKYVSKSTYHISDRLREMGHQICARTVGTILKWEGFSLQANRKTLEGNQNPDRDLQFQFIREMTAVQIVCVNRKWTHLIIENETICASKMHPPPVSIYLFTLLPLPSAGGTGRTHRPAPGCGRGG